MQTAGWGWDPVLVEFGPVRLWYYGLAYAVGLLTIYAWVWLQRERLGYGRRDVVEFALFFGFGVLVGGRAFDVALYEWFYYEEHPWRVFAFWAGGMATHGVILGAVLMTALYCWLRGKSLLDIADAVVVPGAVLMALGRIGNHINGEVYGSVTSVPWALEFPYATGCRHPVAIYDGLKNLLVLAILLLVRHRHVGGGSSLPRGLLLGHFVFWYGFLRLFVDLFRDYDSYWLGIGRGQYFNVLTALVGVAVLLIVRYRARRAAAGEPGSTRPVRRSGGRPPEERGTAGGVLWAERAAFGALVVLCLTIPSGWTQAVLAQFEERAEGAAALTDGCGGQKNGRSGRSSRALRHRVEVTRSSWRPS